MSLSSQVAMVNYSTIGGGNPLVTLHSSTSRTSISHHEDNSSTHSSTKLTQQQNMHSNGDHYAKPSNLINNSSRMQSEEKDVCGQKESESGGLNSRDVLDFKDVQDSNTPNNELSEKNINNSYNDTSTNGETDAVVNGMDNQLDDPIMLENPVSGNLSRSPSSNPLGSRKSSRKLDENHVSHQFFHIEPCLYSHRMFQRAAKIFEVLRSDDLEFEQVKARKRQGADIKRETEIPDMDFKDAQEQIKTFELTFATLKYQEILFEALEKTGFFAENPELREEYSLVCNILNDLQSRKFQRRVPFPDEVLDRGCYEIEELILSRKTRFLSHIAKERIKKNAPSIDYLLPPEVRDKDETKSKTPVYLWVNMHKIKLESMLSLLDDSGFKQVDDEVDMSEQTENVFSIDSHCADLLCFPCHLSLYFKESSWVKTGMLVQQDKSSCLAPQTVQYLLGTGHDAIHVNIGTGMTTAHVSSLIKGRSPTSHIFAFLQNPRSDKLVKATKNLEFLGSNKSVKVLTESFLDTDPEDSRFKSVRLILITANCSKSAITSPVQFIVSEGEDMQILGELSKTATDISHINRLTLEHITTLQHALRFPKLQAVVYSTRSRHQSENENAVNTALEYCNRMYGRKPQFMMTPPLLPFTGKEISTGEVSGVVGPYIKFLPSDKSNGCFISIIAKEPEDLRDSKSALSRMKSKSSVQSKASSMSTEQSTPDQPIKRPKSKNKSKSVTSSSGVSSRGSEIKMKVSQHKTPAAIGARLYQASLLQQMEKSAKPRSAKSEHQKVVKHPAPFSDQHKLEANHTDNKSTGEQQERQVNNSQS